MKIISFSIWGSNPLYTTGAIRNAEIAPAISPDWTCRFYADAEVPLVVRGELKRLGSQVVVMNNTRGPWEGLFWRCRPGWRPCR
jgi:hypothetical protein